MLILFPKMSGRPLLPVPITTTLAFGDLASSWVAEIPCQARTEGVRLALIVLFSP